MFHSIAASERDSSCYISTTTKGKPFISEKEMSKPPDKPPDRGEGLGMIPLDQVQPATNVTPSRLGGSVGRSAKMRSFAQIVAEEKQSRNILEIKMTRLQIDEEGVMKPAKSLNVEDVSILVFDVMKVKPEDCLGVALSTSRYDTKEIKLKPGVDATQYLTKENPIIFKDHEVTVISQTANITKVTFRNVNLAYRMRNL